MLQVASELVAPIRRQNLQNWVNVVDLFIADR